jgi:hypothetical protein
MFSTNDDGIGRILTIRISGREGDRVIPIPDPLAIDAYLASMFPTESRLRDVAGRIAAMQSRPVSGGSFRVHVSAWRLDYDPRTLAPRPEIIREYTLVTDEESTER